MDDIQFAIKMAKKAGQLIKNGFQRDLKVDIKDDGSPVTHIDRLVDDIIKKEIEKAFPTDHVLSEENGGSLAVTGPTWIYDPLDGTKAYIMGVPNATFVLARFISGSPILGVVYDPFADRIYYAKAGAGAFLNGKKISVNSQGLAGGYFATGSQSSPYATFAKSAGAIVEPVAGTAYKYMMVADGRAAGIIKDTPDIFDGVASSLIIREAGGLVVDTLGKNVRWDRDLPGTILFGNKYAISDLLEVIRNRTDEINYSPPRPSPST